MVLAVKVGKRRPFWRGFLLALGSVGIYGRYWDYRAHDEVYKQFELAREGREEGVPWYVMAYPLPVLKFVYYYHFVSNIRYLRMRMGFARNLSPGGFLGLSIPGTASLVLAFVLFASLLPASFGTDAAGDSYVQDPGLMQASFIILAVGVVAWVTLRSVAYFRLQSDINGIWETYETRSAVLRGQLRPAAPAGTVWPSATAPPAGPSSAMPPPRW